MNDHSDLQRYALPDGRVWVEQDIWRKLGHSPGLIELSTRDSYNEGEISAKLFRRGFPDSILTFKARERGEIGQDNHVLRGDTILQLFYNGDDGSDELITIVQGELKIKYRKNPSGTRDYNVAPGIVRSKVDFRVLPDEFQEQLTTLYGNNRLSPEQIARNMAGDQLCDQLNRDMDTLKSMGDAGLTSPKETAKIVKKWIDKYAP